MTGAVMEKVEELVEFLGGLSAGENPTELKSRYTQLLALANPVDFAWAGEKLFESGMTTYDYCRLCEKVTALCGDQVAIFRASLAAEHPMQRVFFQHKRYLRILDDIENLNKSIANLHPAWAGCPEYQQLKGLLQEVDWVERHTAAEQNVLLPEIERHDNGELTKIVKYQHFDLEQSYKQLKVLIGKLQEIDFHDLKQQFNSITQWLAPIGRMHITVEENVFYPIAATLIEGKATWDKFLAICNQPEQIQPSEIARGRN
jgi:DUF438 domain-containing protein